MDLTLWTALIVAAVIASITLIVQERGLAAAAAVLLSGLEALIAFGVVSLQVRSLSVGLVLSAALTLAGAMAWGRAATKTAASAATVVTLVGVVQVLTMVEVLH